MRLAALLLLLPLSVLAQDELNSETGLIGRWLVPGFQTGNGAVPTTALDASRVGNVGTFNGSIQWVKSPAGQAAGFSSGSSTYVELGSSSTFRRQAPFSMACWFMITNLTSQAGGPCPGFHFILSNDSNSFGVYLYYRNSGQLAVGRYYDSANPYFTGTNGLVRVNTPYSAIASVGSNYLTLYVNGVRVSSITNANTSIYYETGRTTLIGRCGCGNVQYYTDGYIWDTRFYNHAVGDTEAENIYQQGLK